MGHIVWLEFMHENGAVAANGSDITFFIDGRWNHTTLMDKVYERVSALREGPFGSRYSNQLFIGWTYAGGHDAAIYSKRDLNPPAWFDGDWNKLWNTTLGKRTR